MQRSGWFGLLVGGWMVVMCGCSGGVVQTALPVLGGGSGAGTTAAPSVTNFGDSITCGSGAWPPDGGGRIYSNEGYAGQLDTALGIAANNLCRGGDQGADMARAWVYPNAVPQLGASQLFSVMIGANDVWFCGATAGCIANWYAATAVSLAWLALPASDKMPASEMSASGSWQTDPVFSMGMVTSSAGSKLSFAVQQTVAGRMLNLGYRVVDASVVAGGSADIAVDGKVVASVQTNPASPIATHNGGSDTVFLVRVPLGAAGRHVVTVTTSSAGQFSLLWAGIASQDYKTVTGAPRVLVNKMLQSPDATFATELTAYNVQLTAMVNELRGDGMYLTLAPTDAGLDLTTDYADPLHPDLSGHTKIAAIDLATVQAP